MRNLKKVLSLVLCLAVMLSVMVVGAGAAFSDQDKIENTEAVDACSALNIINGYEDGAFHPERNIKRAEVTKMICVALNGGEEPNTSTNAKPTFTDVRGTIYAWAEGYIEACVAQGIVDGVGGTRFAPASNVTGAQLAKMLLVSLGYNAKTEQFTGNAWETNVNVRAAQKHLYDGLEKMDTSAPVTRDQAAQMVWNAMQAYEVEYKDGVLQDKFNSVFGRITLMGDKYEVVVNVGTLVSIDNKTLEISMSDSDKANSDQPQYRNFMDLDVDYSALIGQKVKVMFKVDKPNEVLGVFATADNTLVVVNQNEIDVDAGKIVVGDKSYAVEKDGVKVIRDGETSKENWKAGVFKDQQSADVITLIDSDNNNKIDTAYIKSVSVAKVTYVASSQIIAGSKTYKFADDSIDKDVKKDDWVMVTKNMYNDNNDVVVVAKKTGKVEATKVKGTAPDTWTQYQIGDTWYNEAKANSGKDINTNVKPGVDAEYVAVNGILYYAAKTSAGANKLADVLFVSYVGVDGLTNDQARVMFPNGDKTTINLKNDYFTKQDGTKGTAIVPGNFYEYNKSGNTYELVELSDRDDFYGDFTYEGMENLTSDGDAVNTSDRIADSAEVIVWTTDSHSDKGNTTAADVKHITGKQLKALVASGDLAVDDTAANSTKTDKLYVKTLGYFTSDVDGLNRASVVAVEYHGYDKQTSSALNGTFSNVFDDISSNANYAFITKDAVKLANGNIKFTVWTGNANVEVIAEKSRENDFTKGTIVGYTAIEDKDGKNVMTDPVAITDTTKVKAGSITSVNTKFDTIENNIGAAEDLDDYSTVLYVDSKAGTGVADGKATKANSQKVDNATYYATNLLVYGTEVAVIDVNEIAGSRYGGHTLPDTIAGLTDVQWLNTRTNDTDEGAAYKGAVMQLSFYADKSGTLTLNNVADIATNDNDGTVTLNVKGGDYNKFDSLIVTGNGNVTATFAADGSTPPQAEGTVLLASLTNGTQAYKANSEITAKLYSEKTSTSLGMAKVKITKDSTPVADGMFTVKEVVVADGKGDISITPTDTAMPGTYKVSATFAGVKSNELSFTITHAKIDTTLAGFSLAAPTNGQKPVADVTLACTQAGVDIGASTVTWYKNTTATGAAMAAGDSLATGDNYSVVVVLKASDGYVFDGTYTATVCGQASQNGVVGDNGSTLTFKLEGQTVV